VLDFIWAKTFRPVQGSSRNCKGDYLQLFYVGFELSANGRECKGNHYDTNTVLIKSELAYTELLILLKKH